MKKFLKIFLLAIILFALGYSGYTSYKKSAALVNVIHEDADAAIKVGVQDIKETLVWDAITSPKYYYDGIPPSKYDEEDKEKEDKGVDLQPYNLVAFTVPNINNTLFSVFQIYDTSDFEAFAKKELDKKSVEIQDSGNGYLFAFLKDSKLAVAWNKEQMVVAASPKLDFTKATKIFTDILIDKKTIEDKEHPLIKSLKKESSHLVYTDGESTSTVNFSDGKALLKGNLFTNAPDTFPKEVSLETIPDASLSFHFDANFENSAQKMKAVESLSGFSFLEKNNLDPFKIANRTNGFVSFAVAGKTVQMDTVITYEYDDNFEKVAQKTVQEKEVPRITINLGSADKSLREYLMSVGTVDSNTIFTPFPLYQLYVKEAGLHTSFDTYKGIPKTQKRINSNFLDFKVDFEKLQKDLDIQQTKQLFSLLSDMRIHAWQEEGRTLKLEGSLNGKNPDINILSQLFFGMQPTQESQIKEEDL